jgi:aspartokinase-like uncharacterized kinase
VKGDGPRPTVLKVGGSLLVLPDLAARIPDFLEREAIFRPVLCPGGGAIADLVRVWDRVHALGEERSHRLALAAMALNGLLLVEVLPKALPARDGAGLSAAWEEGAVPVLDARAFIEAEERRAPGEPLPHLWTATSDSVAAWIAGALGAGELVLAKSAPPPPGSLTDLARLGYLDEHFPRIARGIPRISAVDLRGPNPSRRVLI